MSQTKMALLKHRTILDIPSLYEVALPLCEGLREYHPNGVFPLVHDPNIRQKATLVGMFVLRPSVEEWRTSNSSPDFVDSIYQVKGGWAYNFDGIDGGWLISGKNGVDALRLALQYGASDAVLLGTRSASAEGCDPLPEAAGAAPTVVHMRGYLWQAHVLCQWQQLASQDPDLASKIQLQRELWQSLGYLSDRKYPATIMFTVSGDVYDGSRDFLEARVFSDRHPTGEEYEVYIITSTLGAAKIRSRAAKFGLEGKIDKILIELSPAGRPDDVDVAAIPVILFERYGMKIVNHDGGQAILRRFCQEGTISQMNLTLMKQKSLRSLLESRSLIQDESIVTRALETFQQNTRNFFTGPDGSIPRTLKPFTIIEDEQDEVAIVSFVHESGGGFDF